MDDGLSAEMRAVLAKTAELMETPPPEESIPARRARLQREGMFWRQGAPTMVAIRNWTLPGGDGESRPVGLRLYRPNSAPHPRGIVYLHGGGWLQGNVETHDGVMRRLAQVTGAVVVGVDYALAPEYPFPRGLNDSLAAYRYIAVEAERLQIDPARLVLAGDSAGANLAIATCLRLREAREPLPRAVLTYYGVFDSDFTTESYRRFSGPPYPLSAEEMRGYFARYAPIAQHDHPLIAVARAALHGLPPVYVAAAECDVLRDDALNFAAALARHDVPHELRRFAGVTHSFAHYARLLPEARSLLLESADFLERHVT